MKSKLNSWFTRIDNITSLFSSEFGYLNYVELNWKPSPDVWSIAQVTEHLINTNITYFPVFAKAGSEEYQVPFTAKIPGLPIFFGNLILKTVSPENLRKTKTFPVWQPSSGKADPDILVQFAAHQDELKERIMTIEPLLDKDIIISSPANKFIVYKIDTAIDIIVSHEERHYNQAAALKNLIKNKT